MLLTDYTGANVRGWLMSEKLDGWRVLWDGQNFFSRELGLLAAPEWFKAGMPAVALDGELFAGRGEFNAIQGMMRDDQGAGAARPCLGCRAGRDQHHAGCDPRG